MWFRSKPKETAEEKNTNIEKPKPDKKKKRRPRRIAVKIWVNVIMLAIIGLLCLNAYLMWTVYPKNVSAVQKQKEPVQNIQVLNTEGASKFAKDFAAEWVQGNLDRVNYYLAIGYQLPKDALDGTKRKVLWAQEANVTQISANRVNVVVKLGVEMPSANQKTPTFKVVYLSVPLIVEADGKYGVCDIPTYLPDPGRATFVNEETESGINLPLNDQEEIKKKINFFFEEYVMGSPDKLAFVFNDQKQRAVLNGKLLSITEVKISGMEDQPNMAKVRAVAQVELDGVKSLIRFHITMRKNGNQWFIDSTEPSIPLYTPMEEN